MEEYMCSSKVEEKRPLNILLLEDSRVDAHILKIMLKNHVLCQCNVEHALNMQEAEAILKSEIDIDIILLDLGLPDTKDALDTYERIKSIPRKIPVVVLTGESNQDLASYLVDNGVEDFINKCAAKKNPGQIWSAIDFAMRRYERMIKKQGEKDMVIEWMMGGYSA